MKIKSVSITLITAKGETALFRVSRFTTSQNWTSQRKQPMSSGHVIGFGQKTKHGVTESCGDMESQIPKSETTTMCSKQIAH